MKPTEHSIHDLFDRFDAKVVRRMWRRVKIWERGVLGLLDAEVVDREGQEVCDQVEVLLDHVVALHLQFFLLRQLFRIRAEGLDHLLEVLVFELNYIFT